jgi:His Kinase A (phospho-acceptor) domain
VPRSATELARLVGWGLFDNTLDEDLDAVELTLISGRPVSFTYELAEARVPSRPQVSDDPSSLEQATGDRGTAEAISTLAHELRSPLTSIRGYAELLGHELVGALSHDQRAFVTQIRDNAGRIIEQLNGLFELVRIRDRDNPILSGYLYRAGPLGDLKVSSSYFLPVQMGNAEQAYLTYRVPTPVSVRRGQAAMVPIIDTEVQFEPLCVYNGAKMSNHPLLVWRLCNTSGVALEQGPITVAADGRYLGEGLVRFTGVDDDLQIPYALEFGLLVGEAREYSPRVLRDVRFNAEERRADVTWYHVTRTRYTVASNVGRDTTLLIEHRDPQRGEFYEMAAPADAREGHTRWSVHVPARATAEVVIQEREARTSYENVATWSAGYVEELHAVGGIDAVAYGHLQELVAITQQRTTDDARKATIDVELTQLLELQEQLRKNLGALGDSEREVTLHNRLLDDLEASEERRRAIAVIRREIDQHGQERDIRHQALIDQLYSP